MNHSVNCNDYACKTERKRGHFWFATHLGGYHFLRKGVPNLPKVGVHKTVTPYFCNKNVMTLHHRYTLSHKQAKIVLKSVFSNKINTLSVVILWLPTFWLSKILWPSLFFFQKNYDPPSIFGTPPSGKNDSPLNSYLCCTKRVKYQNSKRCFHIILGLPQKPLDQWYTSLYSFAIFAWNFHVKSKYGNTNLKIWSYNKKHFQKKNMIFCLHSTSAGRGLCSSFIKQNALLISQLL